MLILGCALSSERMTRALDQAANMNNWPLGVFASVDAGLGVSLETAHLLGVPTVHLHAPKIQTRTPRRADEIRTQLSALDITATCVFAGFDGESYADIATVRRTVGLAPPGTRAARIAELKAIADFARALDVASVGLHLGFVPHDEADPDYRALVETTREVCEFCGDGGLSIHLETGQEPADVLERLLTDVGRDNLFVNFDPANMILYGVGEPLVALKQLGSQVRSVHCKDAIWSDRPGESWGSEVPLGEGAVDFAAFLSTLRRIGYDGPLTIEREIPHEPTRQRAELGQAIELLKRLQAKM